MIDNKINVLLVSGRVIGEHYYPADNERIRRMLESTGRFDVKITEEFNGVTEKTLEGYDVLFMNYDGRWTHRHVEDAVDKYGRIEGNYGPYTRWEPGAEEVFFNFIKNGGGAYVHHSSITLPEYLPDDYYKMMGVLRKKGRRRHLNAPDGFDIHFAENTPFGKDLPRIFRAFREDFYLNVPFDPEARTEVVASVFETLEPWVEIWNDVPQALKEEMCAERAEDLPNINQWQPVSWTNLYGEGRVFVNALGNDYETMNRIPYLTMLCRGVEWAATGKITIDPPDTTSGNKKFRPWPYYNDLPEPTKTYKDIISNYM